MGTDINSLIANYLSNNSSEDVSSVASRLKNLASSSMITYNSIFEYGETADESEFLTYFQEASGDESDQIAEDVSMLFEILDQDGNGSLSDEELELFQRETGQSRGKIDGFGLFNDLINVNESSILSYMDELDNNDDDTSISTVGSSSSDSDTKGLSDDDRIKTDEDGNSYVLVEKWTSYDSSVNSCLNYIIKNSYDFDTLGVSYSEAKDKLLAAIIDENNISNQNLVYTNQKIILPDAYEILGIDES